LTFLIILQNSFRTSLKRIGAALDADERRRNEDKFHHQFNYSLNQ
jgi:hypothetical protein